METVEIVMLVCAAIIALFAILYAVRNQKKDDIQQAVNKEAFRLSPLNPEGPNFDVVAYNAFVDSLPKWVK
jgi:hypothetical protein